MDESTPPQDPGAPQRRTHKVRPINDLDLTRWRDYTDIQTDSLWLIPERDRSGAHAADYHGNFVPQVPRLAMTRFTRAGEAVLDLFVGSGTTLIECRRLGRDGIGIELNPNIADLARKRVDCEPNLLGSRTVVQGGNSASPDETEPAIRAALGGMGHDCVHLAVLHPPYHDAVRFSECAEDLSNCPDVSGFLERFEASVDLATRFLAPGRYLVLVIGDIYAGGEWVPLGFRCMDRVLRHGYRLKSLVVKDMRNNRAKRGSEPLWRYRALVGGYFVFRHEYVMFFVRDQGQPTGRRTKSDPKAARGKGREKRGNRP